MPSQPVAPSTRPFAALSTKLQGKTDEEIIDLCVQAGFAGIEGHSFLVLNKSESELEKIAARYHAAGLKIHSFHLPYMDLASLDNAARLFALEILKIRLRQVAALGVRAAITHPTTSYCTSLPELDLRFDALEKSLTELLPLAASLGITIALENLSPAGAVRIGSAPEHFEIFKERFAHEALGFCLDTGHALLARHARAADFAEAMKPRLAAFHLNDNAGDRDSHLAPGRGLVDWAFIGNLLREIDFTAPACIETPPFAYGPDYSLDSWKELRANTAALLPLH